MSTSELRKRARKYEMARPSRGLTGHARVKRVVASSKETGYFDTAVTAYGLDSTGSVTLLNPVPQGSTVSQRVGKKIVMRGLMCRGRIFNNDAALLNDLAYMIIYDKRPTGSLPSITDILVSISPSSMNNDNNSGRFETLKRVDDVLIGNTSGTGSTYPSLTECTAKDQTWYLPLKDRVVVYKALGTGAIADIEEGALYLITLGSTAAGTGAATLNCGFRMRFLDV